MKCEEVGVRLCRGCEHNRADFSSHWNCFIEIYADNMTWYNTSEENVKKTLLEFIMYPGKISMIHFGEAVKQSYPGYYDWYQKLLVLQ